jgi:hypothetical protein
MYSMVLYEKLYCKLTGLRVTDEITDMCVIHVLRCLVCEDKSIWSLS